MGTQSQNFSPDQKLLLARILTELGHDERKLYDSLTEHERQFVLDSFVDALKGDSRRAELLWEVDFVRKPVSVHEFINHKDYFGSVGKELYPCWVHELDYLFCKDNQVNEVVVTGSIGCLAGETPVHLLNGTTPSIKELADNWNGKPIYVYSFDVSSGEITVGSAVYPHCSGKNVDTWAVKLDDGSEIICTSDHPFMMRNKQYLMACRLEESDSLMPLYKYNSTVEEDGFSGYEKIYQPVKERYDFTHRMVARWKYGTVYKGRPNRNSFNTIHHKDFTPANNDPTNLLLTTWFHHKQYHSRLGNPKVLHDLWNNPEWRAWFIERRTMAMDIMNGNPYIRMKQEASKRANGHFDRVSDRVKLYNRTHPNRRDDITESSIYEWAPFASSLGELSDMLQCSRYRLYTVIGGPKSLKFKSLMNEVLGSVVGRSDYSLKKNHCVLSIKYAGKRDVYDLVVPGLNNFAVGSGVFVHNTGKTTLAILALAYKIYWMTCLRNPNEYYGLMEGMSQFCFGLFNATVELSQGVHVAKILGAFSSSPYFRWLTSGTIDEPERLKDVIKFPNAIKFIYGSRAIHALGSDLVGGLLDELNFRTETVNANQAKELYRNTKRRVMSRFPPREGRKSPGLLFLVSSRRGEEDFLDVHVREVGESDPTVRVISYSLWDAKGHIPGMYPSGKWFRVVVGDDRFSSRILEDSEPDPIGYQVVRVPEEHRRDFTLDPNGCLVGDTLIPLLSGVSVPIRDLVECDSLYVYSYTQDGRLHAGRAHSARSVGVQNVYTVVLDNYEEVRCTANHPFMLRDGSFKLAYQLSPGDSLMPCNRRVYKGYELIQSNLGCSWRPTHRIIKVLLVDHADWDVEEVFDLTVDGYENFALESGVVVHNSLMDIAGVAVKGGGRPLINREYLYDCISFDKEYHPRKHPFKSETVTIGLRSKATIEDEFIWQDVVQCIDPYKNRYMPIVNPSAPRYIHLDPATTGDCKFGFGMGHIAGRTRITRRDISAGIDVDISAPVVYIDMMLGIFHPAGDEIDFAKIRSFILFLRKLGYPIYSVTADQYQSADTLQIFHKLGFKTDRWSLDSKPDNYGMYRNATHEGRVLLYEYQPFIEEVVWLQVDRTNKDKVYCLEGRHKDLSDAVAGVVSKIMVDDEAEHSALSPIQPEKEIVIPNRHPKSIDDLGEWMMDEITEQGITGIR